MGYTSTHTFAILEVSEAAYEEIKTRLEIAGYQDQFHEERGHGLVIDMHGLAVAKQKEKTDVRSKDTRRATITARLSRA